jgi:hypothetical protein
VRTSLLCCLLLALLAASTRAQTSGDSSAPSSEPQRTAPAPDRVPVPEPTEQALAYYRSGNVLWVVDIVWALLLSAVFLFTGFSAWIRHQAQRATKTWLLVVGLYFIAFSVISFAIDLPLSYYEGFVRQHAYGLSNQTFGKWARDEVISLAVTLVIGVLTLWVPYLLLRKSPRRWWLYTGLAAIPLIVLISLVQPIWIDPLFNAFGPMKDQALEADILRLAERAGIEGSRVFEVAKSEDTKTVNAYVAGVGGTKRIVLWDTILAKLNRGQRLPRRVISNTKRTASGWRSRRTTTPPRPASSCCSRKTSACPGPARCTSCGEPVTRYLDTASTSAMTIVRGNETNRWFTATCSETAAGLQGIDNSSGGSYPA